MVQLKLGVVAHKEVEVDPSSLKDVGISITKYSPASKSSPLKV